MDADEINQPNVYLCKIVDTGSWYSRLLIYKTISLELFSVSAPVAHRDPELD